MVTREEAIQAAGEVYGAILADPERRAQLRRFIEAKEAAQRAVEAEASPPETVVPR